MQTIATALSPFVKQTIKITLGSAAAVSAMCMVIFAPMWMTCGATCDASSEAEARMAAFMQTHGPDASFSAQHTLELQLGALGSNAALGEDFGIRYAFALASDANRAATGPFARFARMVKAGYAPLLDYQTVDIEPLGGCNSRASFLVHVVDADGKKTSYAWSLSRREADGAWVTDGVLEVDADALSDDEKSE